MADSLLAALQAGTSHACPSTRCTPVCPCPRATRRTTSGACTHCKSYPSRALDPTFGLDHPEKEEHDPLTLRLDDPAFAFVLGSTTSWYFCQKKEEKRRVSSGSPEPMQDVPLEPGDLSVLARDTSPAVFSSA